MKNNKLWYANKWMILRNTWKVLGIKKASKAEGLTKLRVGDTIKIEYNFSEGGRTDGVYCQVYINNIYVCDKPIKVLRHTLENFELVEI